MSQSEPQIDAGRWRSRLLVIGGLGAVTALSWLYLVRMNAGMGHGGMAHMTMPAMPPSLPAQLVAAFIMWSIMMVAMMLPTALPAVTVFGNLARRRGLQVGATTPTSLYVVGYVAAWTGYSAVAAVGQVALARAALLTPMLQSASIALSAVILLAAGAFQFTSLKDACLSKCRTPFAYFLAEWRDGKAGALRLGSQAWQLLRRLLLGADGGDVRGRRHEPRLDGGADTVRARRETGAGALAISSRGRYRAGAVGSGCRGLAHSVGLSVILQDRPPPGSFHLPDILC